MAGSGSDKVSLQRRLRFGFVGAGRMGVIHASNVARVKGTEIVGVADPHEEARRSFCQVHNCRGYETWEQLLKTEQCDALYICLPVALHGPVECEAARLGIHMFIEKPISLDLEVCKKVERAIKAAGVISCVGYQWRYLDVVKRARAIIGEAAVGLVTGHFLIGLPPVHWIRDKKSSGGQVIEQMTHLIDLSRLFAGEAATVYASYSKCLTSKDELETEDITALLIRHKGGAVGQFYGSYGLFYGYPNGVGVSMIARELGVSLWLRPSLRINESQFSLSVARPRETIEIQSAMDPYFREDEVFVEAVRTGDSDKIESPYSDALQSQTIACSANDSAKAGRVLEVET